MFPRLTKHLLDEPEGQFHLEIESQEVKLESAFQCRLEVAMGIVSNGGIAGALLFMELCSSIDDGGHKAR